MVERKLLRGFKSLATESPYGSNKIKGEKEMEKVREVEWVRTTQFFYDGDFRVEMENEMENGEMIMRVYISAPGKAYYDKHYMVGLHYHQPHAVGGARMYSKDELLEIVEANLECFESYYMEDMECL